MGFPFVHHAESLDHLSDEHLQEVGEISIGSLPETVLDIARSIAVSMARGGSLSPEAARQAVGAAFAILHDTTRKCTDITREVGAEVRRRDAKQEEPTLNAPAPGQVRRPRALTRVALEHARGFSARVRGMRTGAIEVSALISQLVDGIDFLNAKVKELSEAKPAVNIAALSDLIKHLTQWQALAVSGHEVGQFESISQFIRDIVGAEVWDKASRGSGLPPLDPPREPGPSGDGPQHQPNIDRALAHQSIIKAQKLLNDIAANAASGIRSDLLQRLQDRLTAAFGDEWSTIARAAREEQLVREVNRLRFENGKLLSEAEAWTTREQNMLREMNRLSYENGQLRAKTSASGASDAPEPCCKRDTDKDGNCDQHPVGSPVASRARVADPDQLLSAHRMIEAINCGHVTVTELTLRRLNDALAAGFGKAQWNKVTRPIGCYRIDLEQIALARRSFAQALQLLGPIKHLSEAQTFLSQALGEVWLAPCQSVDLQPTAAPADPMIMGLVRAAELLEREQGGQIWGDIPREALEEATRRGLAPWRVNREAEATREANRGASARFTTPRAQALSVGRSSDLVADASVSLAGRGWERIRVVMTFADLQDKDFYSWLCCDLVMRAEGKPIIFEVW